MTASRRYTVLPSPTLEVCLDQALAAMGQEIGALELPKLAAVVLGGGYGRDEGGVLHNPSGDRLYNDLDFFVFAQDASRQERARIDRSLASLAPKWARQLQVAIDFGPTKNIDELSRVEHTLMFQELLRGWKPVWGEIDLNKHLKHLDASQLPVTEAMRLLLNRGMGLLLAGERLANNRDDQDFIVRNIHKAMLGAGDALLLVANRYAWSARDRLSAFQELARLQNLPPEFFNGYETAYRFKIEPVPVLPPQPWESWTRARQCWLKAVQLAANQTTATADAVRDGLHQAARPERSLRNFLRWTLRARHLRPVRLACDAPVVTLLGMLYGELQRERLVSPLPPQLLQLWQHFN